MAFCLSIDKFRMPPGEDFVALSKESINKRDLGYSKLPAVEFLQTASVCSETKAELPGTECLMIAVPAGICAAILGVAQQRVTGVGHLSTDLMCASGDEFDLHQGQPVPAF